MSTSSNFHVHVTLELSNEQKTMWDNKHVLFLPLVMHPMRINGGFLLDRFGVTKPAHSCAIFPLLAVFERVLGRGRGVVDDV